MRQLNAQNDDLKRELADMQERLAILGQNRVEAIAPREEAIEQPENRNEEHDVFLPEQLRGTLSQFLN